MEFENIKWIGRKKDEIFSIGNEEQVVAKLKASSKEALYNPDSLLLRKTFTVKNPVKKATIRICGMGLYDLHINAFPVSDSVLMPLVTQYNKRVLYDVYDITDKLIYGTNVFIAELGGGYYCPPPKYWSWRMFWHGNHRMAASIDIEYFDNSSDTIRTDESWKLKQGAFTKNCIYDGVTLDARLYEKNLHLPDFDDSEWDYAVSVEAPSSIQENIYPHIKVCESFDPDNVNIIDKFNSIYSFPQNRTGWVKIGIKGNSGDIVTLIHAERLHDDGSLNAESNRLAENTDRYILSGEGVEYFTPKFTYHGFKYVQCIKSCENIEIVEIVQESIRSEVENTGYFISDNDNLNKIHNACVTTFKNAYIGMPLDCPQRDERLAWLNDAYITSISAMCNFDMRSFYKKWLDDIKYGMNANGAVQIISPHVQVGESADLSSGYPLIVLNYYKFYKDKSFLEHHYGDLGRYCEYLLSESDNFILPRSRYGDWSSCEPDFVRGDPEYTNTLYLYYVILMMCEFSQILNKSADKEKYDNLLKQMNQVLIDKYYNKESKIFGDGSVFSTSFALLLEIIPKADQAFAADYLNKKIIDRNYCLYTGIFGTKYAIDMLCKFGYEKTALKVVLNENYPGWLYMIQGSTTLTERWDGVSDSLNHGMFGSVDAQLYKILGGVDIDCRNEIPVKVMPYFSDMCNHISCSVFFSSGIIKSEWTRNRDKITLCITLPEKCNAKFVLHKDFQAKKILWNGKNAKNEFILNETMNIIEIV